MASKTKATRRPAAPRRPRSRNRRPPEKEALRDPGYPAPAARPVGRRGQEADPHRQEARLRHPRPDQRRPALGGGQFRADRGRARDVLARWASTWSRPRRPTTTRRHGRADDEPEAENELVEVQQKVPAKAETKEPTERTDDPVRMYLREMGSVELLSREGEIAIAKRIEAGREAMIAGLCESPLTFQAIIIWRDELNDEQDLPARHHRSRSDLCRPRRQGDAGAGRSRRPAAAGRRRPAPGTNGQPAAADAGARHRAGRARRRSRSSTAAPATRTATARSKPEGAADGDFDDDDMENSLSLAAIEAELKPKVLETFDTVASEYKRLRRLQDQDIELKLKSDNAHAGAGAQVQEAQGRDHHRGEVAAPQPGAHRFAGRAALRHQQAPRRLRGPPDAARREPRRHARGLPQAVPGLRARPALAQPRVEALRQGLEEPRRQGQGQDQGAPPRRSRRSPARPGSRSASSARSCTWCRRASARRARPRRRWWRRTCAS